MPLTTGTKLGTFEITASLGKGGMGEVYRATDKNLGRDVAIKVLLEGLASDPDRLARFQREAQILASLNHINVATVHGFEYDDEHGVHFLVMEYIDGETLGERISRGVLTVEEALPIFGDIARGLSAAHEQGIIHRDLKPDNIKITANGVVKILDFGLAKNTVDQLKISPDAPTTPMSPVAVTAEGTFMGTPMYMSPEQARGIEVDKRTDVWAFGCCLFEALTGEFPFKGDTIADVVGAILQLEPDWNSLSGAAPNELTSLLHRFLEKDKSKRISSMGDIAITFENILEHPAASTNKMSSATSTFSKPLGIAAVLLVVIGAAWFGNNIITNNPDNSIEAPVQSAASPEPKQIKRFLLGLDVADRDHPNYGRVAISPDGSLIAYITGDKDDERFIAVRRIDELEGRILSGTNGAWTPFFSPDGQSIGYLSLDEKKIKRVPVEGGEPREICDVSDGFNASWGDDGYIVFADSDHRELQRVVETGGTPEPITSLDLTPGSKRHANPHVLPNGAGILFTSFKSYGNPEDESMNVLTRDGKVLQLVTKTTRYHYTSTGHVVYFVGGEGVFTRRFDPDTYELGDESYLITETGFGTSSSRLFDISRTGTLVYAANKSDPDNTPLIPNRELVWVYLDGAESLPLPIRPKPYTAARISPDATRIALTGENDVYIYDIARTTISPIAMETDQETSPVWSPDGLKIIYSSRKDNVSTIYKRLADGTGTSIPIMESEHAAAPDSWSPDGKVLSYTQPNPGTSYDVGVVSLESETNLTPEFKIQTTAGEGATSISPDGKWIAYLSVESGEAEVYVTSFPDFNGKWIISVGGGTEVSWAPNGEAIYYRAANKMMKVPVSMSPTFEPGTPELLWEREYYSSDLGIRTYGVHPDGDRFLMIEKADQLKVVDDSDDVIVIENWFEELKRIAPHPE
jgi:serine/threonine-protein kinase